MCCFFTEYTVLLILLLWAGSDTEYEDENQKSLKASKISRRQELDPKLRYLYGITPVRFVPQRVHNLVHICPSAFLKRIFTL
jgi:hypothetical protein